MPWVSSFVGKGKGIENVDFTEKLEEINKRGKCRETIISEPSSLFRSLSGGGLFLLFQVFIYLKIHVSSIQSTLLIPEEHTYLDRTCIPEIRWLPALKK